VILEFVGDTDDKIQRRISATTAIERGSIQIVERLVDANSGHELQVRKYFLDASSQELSRRSLTGESILLLITKSPKLDDVWSGSMQFSESPGQPTNTFGPELPGKCGVASLDERNLADKERAIITVKCEHHASNGERILRFTEYASELGVISLRIDVQGPSGEPRGGYKWRLLRVEKQPS
jgi:hypothetical protein